MSRRPFRESVGPSWVENPRALAQFRAVVQGPQAAHLLLQVESAPSPTVDASHT